jgi:hypothetical protein
MLHVFLEGLASVFVVFDILKIPNVCTQIFGAFSAPTCMPLGVVLLLDSMTLHPIRMYLTI